MVGGEQSLGVQPVAHSGLGPHRLRISREKRMGTSDIVSAPPTTMALACPELIMDAADATAALAEMHAIVTVWHGTVSGNAAPRAHSRARLLVRTAQRGCDGERGAGAACAGW